MPHGWAAEPSGLEPASLGDRFIREASTLALTAPFVLVPVERNVLLNPSHERFAEVAFEHPMAWPLDARFRS